MSKFKIPTIIGVFLLIMGVATGVFLISQNQFFKLGAAPDVTPKDVRITNISDTSFTISWITDKSVVGFVEWGPTPNLGTTAQEASSLAKNVHMVTIRNLSASKDYFFKINSGGKLFDNNSIAWKAQTGPSLAPASNSTFISGTVLNEAGQPVGNVLVYTLIEGVSPLSTLTSPQGDWIIPLGNARANNLKTYSEFADSTKIELFVQAGPLGIASAQSVLSSANPLAPITLGKTHDLTQQSTPPQTNSQTNASVTLPEEESTKQSGFQSNAVPTGSPSTANTVTLESIDPGETIFTTKPEFFGDAPSGSTLTITVESDPITQDLKVPSTGAWKWTPPTNLEPGEHTVTLSWRDGLGILRTLKRSFIVEAASPGDPAFESTPSATPTTTPKASAVPTASASATPTASASATPKATAKASATPVASATPSATVAPDLPVSGDMSYTLLIAMMGFVLLGIGFILQRSIPNDR